MLGLKEICALFAAGSLGAGSVVAVQKVAAPTPIVKKASAPKKARLRPAVAKKPVIAPLAQPQAIAIDDCPVPGSGGMSLADLSPAPFSITPAGNDRYPLPPYYGGGGFYPVDYIPGGGGGGGGGGSLTPDNGGGVPVDPDKPTDPSGPNTPDGGGGIPAVPEPASWVMMIGGVGLVGLALRRQRPHSAPDSTPV